MAKDNIVLRFSEVSFEYRHRKPVLDAVNFSVRGGTKIALMGQNGAGKSSLFSLIMDERKPESGRISIDPNSTVAIGRQVIPRDRLDETIHDFFADGFPGKEWELPVKIKEVLEVVNLPVPPLDKKLREFSGGQQARILLASALIKDPDILLLDEPTNNLDDEGIAHLTAFLMAYHKTLIVISHDADFLNAFTDGVLYLDVHTHKMEQYSGNYYDVVEEISRRIEKEQRENARLEHTIKEKKDQANVFANKGGKLRSVAKRMRDMAQELEDNKVDVKREDKTLPPFEIPATDSVGPLITIKSVSVMTPDGPKISPVNLILKKDTHLLISGPNGIGKSTLLEALVSGNSDLVDIAPSAKIGYYRQDFSTLDFDKTAFEELESAMDIGTKEDVFKAAARFLIPAELLQLPVASLSEGQKGLLMFAQLFLRQPNLLILDEPTNHINFRHIPVIADALDAYKGAMIFVSHVPDFVARIRIDEVIDLRDHVR
ncbi:MAG: ABC-F family ATP-binding cassette domain-containing protein [Candidatus Moranbacteria bacterium]|nr:ABC-F family ATP-binding cassette domain-containing protein [Candidatus Moranbacteria bacterium]